VDPENRRAKATKKPKNSNYLAKLRHKEGAILKPRNLKRGEISKNQEEIYIRDRWDSISQKRKVIDGQSMIGEPRLCGVGSSSWFLLFLPSTTHPQRRRGAGVGGRREERGEETNPKEGFGFSPSRCSICRCNRR
jgi:hypothetical protein